MPADAPKRVDCETEIAITREFDIFTASSLLTLLVLVAAVFGCVSSSQTPLECNGFPKIAREEERRTSDLGVTTLTLPYLLYQPYLTLLAKTALTLLTALRFLGTEPGRL